MGSKRAKLEEIVSKLRQVELLMARLNLHIFPAGIVSCELYFFESAVILVLWIVPTTFDWRDGRKGDIPNDLLNQSHRR